MQFQTREIMQWVWNGCCLSGSAKMKNGFVQWRWAVIFFPRAWTAINLSCSKALERRLTSSQQCRATHDILLHNCYRNNSRLTHWITSLCTSLSFMTYWLAKPNCSCYMYMYVAFFTGSFLLLYKALMWSPKSRFGWVCCQKVVTTIVLIQVTSTGKDNLLH